MSNCKEDYNGKNYSWRNMAFNCSVNPHHLALIDAFDESLGGDDKNQVFYEINSDYYTGKKHEVLTSPEH